MLSGTDFVTEQDDAIEIAKRDNIPNIVFKDLIERIDLLIVYSFYLENNGTGSVVAAGYHRILVAHPVCLCFLAVMDEFFGEPCADGKVIDFDAGVCHGD